ncbi:LytR/AlgR family response regulator transcription factor [Cellulomonas hominis]
MQVSVVEDDADSARALTELLHRYERERGTTLSITLHGDGADLLARYEPSADVLFLDIEMPVLDGLAAAARIRKRDQEVAIVFVTHAVTHAASGYGVDAQSFLVKPVAYPELARELDRVADRARWRVDPTVLLSAGSGPVRMRTSEIVFLEAARRRVLVHTLDGRYTVAGPLKGLEAELAGVGFFRCHHGFVVNLRHVVAVRQLSCRLVSRREVPISRSHRAAFLGALTDYLAIRGP